MASIIRRLVKEDPCWAPAGIPSSVRVDIPLDSRYRPRSEISESSGHVAYNLGIVSRGVPQLGDTLLIVSVEWLLSRRVSWSTVRIDGENEWYRVMSIRAI